MARVVRVAGVIWRTTRRSKSPPAFRSAPLNHPFYLRLSLPPLPREQPRFSSRLLLESRLSLSKVNSPIRAYTVVLLSTTPAFLVAQQVMVSAVSQLDRLVFIFRENLSPGSVCFYATQNSLLAFMHPRGYSALLARETRALYRTIVHPLPHPFPRSPYAFVLHEW